MDVPGPESPSGKLADRLSAAELSTAVLPAVPLGTTQWSCLVRPGAQQATAGCQVQPGAGRTGSWAA